MDSRPDALYNELLLDLAPYLSVPPVEVCGYGPPALVKHVAANHLLDGFTKKFVHHSIQADRNAAETFIASNKTCDGWVPPHERSDLSEADMLLVGQFEKIFDDFFNVHMGDDAEISWPNICENARSGPGSSIGANGGSFYAKHFSSQLTATSESLVEIYKAHCWLYPEFEIAESIRRSEFGAPVIVRGSRTSFAPKNADTSRMICVEPTVNMYLQLGLGSLLEKRLIRFFSLDLSTQPAVNRWMAKMGSERQDDESFSTIDLSSASDSISLRFAGRYIPSEWLSAMLELRCPQTRLMGSDVELRMLSTMGNGFTFPVQTAIFASIVAACVTLGDESLRVSCLGNPGGVYSVFGDDIIVKTKYTSRVLRLLDILGFKVNAAKTFQSGAFRESCGHDYYCGYNIRPVYLKKLGTDQDIAVIINLLNEWSARTAIRVPRLMELLWSFFRRRPLLVPFDENMDAGIRIPCSLLDAASRGDTKIARDGNLSVVYRRWQARPRKIRIGDGTVHVPKGDRRLIYNPPGLLQAYLRGEICNGTISVRANHGLPYDSKRAVTPFWDYQRISHDERVFGLALDKARWNTVVTDNIGHLIVPIID